MRAHVFAAGIMLLPIVLGGPIDAWTEVSFAAHMAQHVVLVVVAPPLLLAGRPGSTWLRALPPHLRRLATAPSRARGPSSNSPDSSRGCRWEPHLLAAVALVARGLPRDEVPRDPVPRRTELPPADHAEGCAGALTRRS
jgi:hypothetical protein